jgi:hypothetical protein
MDKRACRRAFFLWRAGHLFWSLLLLDRLAQRRDEINHQGESCSAPRLAGTNQNCSFTGQAHARNLEILDVNRNTMDAWKRTSCIPDVEELAARRPASLIPAKVAGESTLH